MQGAEVRGLMDDLDSILPWVTAIAVGVALLAQLVVQAVFARASRWPARMSGYAVARQLLHGAGLYELEIEQTAGATLTYFDTRRQCLAAERGCFSRAAHRGGRICGARGRACDGRGRGGSVVSGA